MKPCITDKNNYFKKIFVLSTNNKMFNKILRILCINVDIDYKHIVFIINGLVYPISTLLYTIQIHIFASDLFLQSNFYLQTYNRGWAFTS